jgi:hypothetical protein
VSRHAVGAAALFPQAGAFGHHGLATNRLNDQDGSAYHDDGVVFETF